MNLLNGNEALAVGERYLREDIKRRTLPPPPVPNPRADTLQEACVKRVLTEDAFDQCLDGNFDLLMGYLVKRPKVVEHILYKYDPEDRSVWDKDSSLREELLLLFQRKVAILSNDYDGIFPEYIGGINTLVWGTTRFVLTFASTTFTIRKWGATEGLSIVVPDLDDDEDSKVPTEIYYYYGKALWEAAEQAVDYVKKNV